MKKSAVEWLQEVLSLTFEQEMQFEGLFQQAKEMEKEQQGYSEEDIKSFGDWCRNGLLNTEYGVEKLDEHLEQWKQFKKK